jgi:hypothetical protein
MRSLALVLRAGPKLDSRGVFVLPRYASQLCFDLLLFAHLAWLLAWYFAFHVASDEKLSDDESL